MVARRKIYWSKVLLAFLISAFLFTFGLFVGFLGSKVIEGASVSILDSTRNEIVNLETLNMLETTYSCSASTLDIATDRLGYLTDLIHSMETQKGKTNSQVLELKKLYSIVEVRHMLLLRERAKKCNTNYSIIMYFYSNREECNDKTTSASFILSYLRNKYDNVRIYSYDVDLDSDVIQVLKENYYMSGCYNVVLNDKSIGEIKKSDDVEKYL